MPRQPLTDRATGHKRMRVVGRHCAWPAATQLWHRPCIVEPWTSKRGPGFGVVWGAGWHPMGSVSPGPTSPRLSPGRGLPPNPRGLVSSTVLVVTFDLIVIEANPRVQADVDEGLVPAIRRHSRGHRSPGRGVPPWDGQAGLVAVVKADHVPDAVGRRVARELCIPRLVAAVKPVHVVDAMGPSVVREVILRY